MAIVHLGAKRVQGLKIDRTNDSLGSSADGSNGGITVVATPSYSASDLSWNTSASGQQNMSYSTTDNANQKATTTSHSNWESLAISTKSHTANASTSTEFQYKLSVESGSVHDWMVGLSSTPSTSYGAGNITAIWTVGHYQSQVNGNNKVYVGSTQGTNYTTNTATTTYTLKISGLDVILQYNGVNIHTFTNALTSGSTYYLIASGNGGAGNGFTLDDTKIQKLGTGAYYFDGSDSTKPNVKISDIDLFSGATKEYTLSFWLKADFAHDSSSDNRCIFDFSGSNQIQFFKHPTANWKLNFDSGSDLTLSGGTEAVPDDGAFHHICVTRNSSSLYTVYVDGVSKGTITQTLNVNSGSALNFYLGSYDSVNQEFWKGWIDDVGIWSRVLTATEIGKLANNNASANMGFYAANANQSCADGKFTFDLQRKVGTDTSSWDLYDDVPTSANETSWTSANTVSDETWTLRGKIRFTSIGDDENWCWIALTRNYYGFTSNDAISSSYGIGVQFRFGTSLNTYYTNDLVANGTSFAGQKGTGDNSQNWTPAEDTDYYLEIKRTSTTSYSVSIYTGDDFSTGNVGTITGTCSDTITKLKYIKVMNTYVNPAGTGSDIEGYVSWWKFYDGTNSPSGTPTKTYEFVDGDAQLVSSLSDKSNLKAHYTMDSTSLGATVTKETLDSTNGTSGWNVDNGGSDITIDTGNNEIDITGTGKKSGYYDLGTSVSTSAWLLRFKLTSSGSPSGNPIFWVGVFDANTMDSSSTSVDGISCMIYTGSTYKLSMKNNQTLDSGGSQTNTSPTVSADTTTRYIEIVRNGSNAILTFYDGDDYETSIGTCTVAITGSAFRYLCAVSYFEGSGRTYSLSDVKFYDGVSSLDGCKNDFSSTTALDEQTNLPVNTIFEQIDDTPSYWWKQSDNSWLKSPWAVPATFTDTFTSDNWNDKDSSVAGVNTSNNRLEFEANASGASNHSTVYDLGAGNVSDTKWTLRWEITYTDHSSSGNGKNHAFGISKNDKEYHAGDNTDQIMYCWGEPMNTNQSCMGVQVRDNAPPADLGHFPNSTSRVCDTSLTNDTKYYCTLTRDSATSSTFTIKSGSHDGTALSGFPISNTSDMASTIADLRYIKWQNRGGDGSRSGTSDGYIENVQFYNGVVP